MPPTPKVRKGQANSRLLREEFARRFAARFYDPKFDKLKVMELEPTAWDGYEKARKSPVTRKAGEGFKDPDYHLSVEWLATRAAIEEAKAQQENSKTADRILLICASPRNDKSCPGEMSKTFRLADIAKATLEARAIHVDFLDLSLLTSEYGRVIYPCKGCVSTAMPLCHWPCSCYPNHSLGQVDDWMSEIYPRWVAAHGVMIITPVYWYQAPSTLKLMMDRLVCADGGNPDPSSTHGKKAQEAKVLELEGWSYPRHLAGRSFSVIVHGDAAGAEALRRALVDWLSDMRLIAAGSLACFDRLLGYMKPYASSHEDLDQDEHLPEEVRNAARALANAVSEGRSGRKTPDAGLTDPRPK